MIVMGINMLGIFPWLRKFRIRIPLLYKKVGNKRKTPFIIGLCNGLMPCGPLQSVQIIALAGLNSRQISRMADTGSQTTGDTAVEKNGTQYVYSQLQSGKYPDITVRAGEPVEWEIEASEDNINGCNYKIFLQDFGLEHTFTEGKNIIKFTPEQAGTYTYTCWMGMITGKIHVENN